MGQNCTDLCEVVYVGAKLLWLILLDSQMVNVRYRDKSKSGLIASPAADVRHMVNAAVAQNYVKSLDIEIVGHYYLTISGDAR